MGEKSVPVLEAAFAWARSVNPSQSLMTGVWTDLAGPMSRRIIEFSDIVPFHPYGGLDSVSAAIAEWKKPMRLVICTEWLRR